MVDIPAVFVTAGWLPALLLMCLLSLTAGAATHLLCDAIRLLPGNSHYERRVELLSAVQELLPRYIYKLAFAAFLIRRAGLSLSHQHRCTPNAASAAHLLPSASQCQTLVPSWSPPRR